MVKVLDPGCGEILGAAVSGQALGLCPQVVASCWPCCKEHSSSSIFFSRMSGPCCSLATKMQMSQKVSDIHLSSCFFLNVIFKSPSHSCLPIESLINFSSNGNFFLQSRCVANGDVHCSMDSNTWEKNPNPTCFFLCSCKTREKVGKSTLGSWLPWHRRVWCSRRAMAQVALPSAGTVLGVISHWWHHKVMEVLICRVGNFLANSSFFTKLKQVHLKAFCSSSFLMCSRNSVTFRQIISLKSA